jgi:formylglycine-generating enzyme required for sulfatase activity
LAFAESVVSRVPRIALCLGLVVVALTAAPAAPLAPAPKTGVKKFVEELKIRRLVPPGDGVIEHEARFEMVYVPGGEFVMGSPADEPGREANEGPRHRVKVEGFWLGKCEVTWNEYDLFMLDETYLREDAARAAKLGADAVTRPTPSFIDETYEHGRDGHPVLCITHHAAMMYCHWLRKKTGRAYRLPTEAEWEYAARAGKGDQPYSYGTDPKLLAEYGWFKDNSRDEENFPDKPKGCTHKVGMKKPNPFGLHDMYGNVWEWTLDQYDPKAYETRAKNPLSLRPVTVPTADKWSHVVRGGSWADRAERCRSAARRVSEESWQKHDPQEPRSIWWLTKMDVIGFRVALADEEQRELVGLTPKVVKKVGQ